MLQRRMLSKEEEAASGAEDTEVRREDQDKINRFSRLHQREVMLEDELKSKNKDKEDIEEVSNELELADEDEKIPYKVGDSFFMLPLAEVQELLVDDLRQAEEAANVVQEKLDGVKGEKQELKIALYARFGKSINLET